MKSNYQKLVEKLDGKEVEMLDFIKNVEYSLKEFRLKNKKKLKKSEQDINNIILNA